MSDFSTPTLSQLIAQTQANINARLPGADSRLRRSVLGVLAVIWAGLIYGLYGLVNIIARELLPDTAVLWLARQGAIRGVPQKGAVYATGAATVTGEDDSEIDPNTVLERLDGVQYRTIAAATLVDGEATVPIAAMVAGAAGNAVAGIALTFVSPVEGVDSAATIAADMVDGADVEGRESWRARIVARWQQPAQGGAEADYVDWAKRRPGVTRAWPYPRFAGAGTVGLAFVYDGRDPLLPTGPERDAMKTHIESLCPVHLKTGGGIVILALTEAPDDFEIHLTPDTPQLRAAVTASIADYYARAAEPAATMILSQIREAISLTAGEFDHDIVSPAGNIPHITYQMPALGEIDWGD